MYIPNIKFTEAYESIVGDIVLPIISIHTHIYTCKQLTKVEDMQKMSVSYIGRNTRQLTYSQ